MKIPFVARPRIQVLIVGTFGLGLALGAWALLKQRSGGSEVPGTLPYLAKELRTRGIERHRLGRTIPEHPTPVGGFDQMVAESDAVVLATLVDKRYRMSADLKRIETISKFHVDELLSGTIRRARGLVPAKRLPAGVASLAPLKGDEILLFQDGGTLKVDGVLFQQGSYGYPPLAPRHQFVLFLDELEPQPNRQGHYGDKNFRLYATMLGPGGVYRVEDDAGFSPKLKTHGLADPELKKEIEERFSSRRDFLTDRMRRMGRTPRVQWIEEE